MNKSQIDIIVVDDQPSQHEYFKRIICNEYKQLRVAGTALDGADIVSLYEKCKPDVVILDLMMQPTPGIAALKILMEQHPEAKVIVCSANYNTLNLKSLDEDQIAGWIIKGMPPRDIVDAIETVARGEAYLSKQSYDLYKEAMSRISEFDELSKTEKAIFPQLVLNVRLEMIAKTFHISYDTARLHKSHIFKKLGVNSLDELRLFAFKHGYFHLREYTQANPSGKKLFEPKVRYKN